MDDEPMLYRRFPALRASTPWLALGERPTPVRPLLGLCESGDLWLKDDGVFGSAWGGNKARKLEWVLADALAKRRRTILTVGALGTNHGLATALYARRLGIRTAIALVDQPRNGHVEAQLERLARSGARLHLTHGKYRTFAALPYLVARNTDFRRLRPPYPLTIGGSSALGGLGYVDAGLELAEQVREGVLPEPSHAVVALGSGGTAAGLLLGLRLGGLRTRVVAVAVYDPKPREARRVARLARRTARLLRRRDASIPEMTLTAEEVDVDVRWAGEGYGYPTPDAERARELVREREGLELEPVYTAKAMAGLLALRGEGALSPGPVLYWHTHNALAEADLEALSADDQAESRNASRSR
jgi:D-cysteine desulfhydrase